MILFKKLEYRNFLSTGNRPVTINLEDRRVLISGTNGTGKSTLLSALTFALFGKPLKNINKPSLINSINNKQCEVTLDFSIGLKNYKIIRGIKPNKFEVYEDGSLIDQTAVKDYQEHLEKNIIKTNFRAFTQTTIISIENYIPFMELRAHERRAFIEELLDINVFSTMNQILKSQMSETKQRISDTELKIKSAKDKTIMQKNHIAYIEEEKSRGVETLRDKIKFLEENKQSLYKNLDDYNEDLQNLVNLIDEKKNAVDKMNRLKIAEQQLRDSLKSVLEKSSFYHDLENCPTCKQNIGHDHKDHMIAEFSNKKTDLENKLISVIEKTPSVLDEVNEYHDLVSKQSKINSEITSINSRISSIGTQIREIESDIQKAINDTEKLDEQKGVLKDMVKTGMHLTNLRSSLNEEKVYQEIVYEMLKDTGIKSKIIKQYIPVINTLVNKYLGMFDFFVSFELDENFNEVIKSRHRDTLTYHNFSAGERQKIDMAIMFSFRHIAKIKNSFNSNLLMLDEVLDSSLDNISVDNLFTIFDSGDMKDTNIFIVSHRNKDVIGDKFEKTLEFSKVNGFTEMTE